MTVVVVALPVSMLGVSENLGSPQSASHQLLLCGAFQYLPKYLWELIEMGQ